ncbi:cystathionine beta-lyase, partial [Vibrio parahaemolyticus VPTS-2010]
KPRIQKRPQLCLMA